MKINARCEAQYVEDGGDALLRVEEVDQKTGASIDIEWYYFQDSDNLIRLTEETEHLEKAYQDEVYLEEHPKERKADAETTSDKT